MNSARDRTAIALGAMMMMVLATTGCRSDLTLTLERRRPAAIALPDVSRLGVVDDSTPDGGRLASLARARIAESGAFLAPARDPVAKTTDDASAAKLARDAGADAVLIARVAELDVSRPIENKTTLTKRIPGGGTREVATIRKLRTGRILVESRVVRADGSVARGRAIARDLRFERVDDPEPHAETVAPAELPRDAIPEADEVRDALLRAAAKEIADQVIPRRELATVTWEDAGVDGAAREKFSRREIDQAARELRAILADKSRALDAATQSALLHDLGTCEDLMGDVERAEKHFDESLSLENTEAHQRVLRELRRRIEAKEGAP